MKNDPLRLEQEISLPFDDRVDILFHEIELAVKWDRPSIIFAIYKSDSIRNEVNILLEEKLKNIAQKTRSIKSGKANQFDFVSQVSQLKDLSQTVLLIDGFNWECGVEGLSVLREFNKHREYFIDNNIRAVFWLYENEVSDFAENATECWILRHRVVEFVDVPQPGQGAAQSIESKWLKAENPPADKKSSDNSPQKILNLQEGEKVNTSHANALLSLGILFWRKGNARRALKYLKASAEISKLLSDQSLQAQCQNALALVQKELGNIDDAVSSYQRALSLSPESEFLWNNLGQLLAKNERNEDAIQAFNKALSCSPRDFLSWDGVGHIYLKLGVYQNAISAFEKALEIAPYYESSWVGIGKAYMESGELEKAENSLRKAVELNVRLTDAWINLAKCFAQQKRDADAIAVYYKGIEFNPQNAELWDELGRLYMQKQRYAESISALNEVISLCPQKGEAHMRLAFALFQIGDYETSASVYERSIPLIGDDNTRSAIWNRLGDTYLQMKDYEKAIAAYKQSDRPKDAPEDPGDKNDESIEEIENTLSSSDKNDESLGENESTPANSDKSDELAVEIDNNPSRSDQKIEQNIIGKERGETMIEANHLFDLKTAAEWNEHGNAHLKAGAYNDAIAAYTKAIELAPDACWPYIQNLAHVHYQKGKAKGKLSVGKIEDPDIWEGEDESETTSLPGYDAITDAERGGAAEEPKMERPDKMYSTGKLPVNSDAGRIQRDITNPAACCQRSGKGIDETKREGSNVPTDGSNAKSEDLQKMETEANIPTNKTITAQLVENTPRDAVDWNELGNSLTSAKKLDSAIEAYKKAIEMNPKFGQPFSNLGFIYYRQGKYEEAIKLYKKSIDLLENPEDTAVSWNRLGDAHRRLGDYGNALIAYQKSSESTPTLSPVMARARVTLLENIVAG